MLNLKNISLTFDKGSINEKEVFKNLNLNIEDGDFVTIIGSNGAGKSTLFGVIAGNVITDEGEIILDEKDVTFSPTYKRAKKIGRLLQDPKDGTAPGMTIIENLALATLNGGYMSMIRKKDREYFRGALKKLDMGLEDRLDDLLGLLSGGQRQAISLLMATLNPPSLLLLDEHTAALDPKTAEKVLSITNQIVKEKKITCLMITHNMQQAIDFGNRLIMMNDGKIIFDVKGEEKKKLTVDILLNKFKDLSGEKLDDDNMLLAK